MVGNLKRFYKIVYKMYQKIGRIIRFAVLTHYNLLNPGEVNGDQVKKLWGSSKNISFVAKTDAYKWL